MTKLETLENKIANENIEVIICDLSNHRVDGFYTNGLIGLSDQIKSTAEKRCILDEEYCHYLYNYGNILKNFKQEIYARKKSYERLVPLSALKAAKKAGCRNNFEMAEYLEVTEEIFLCAIRYYKSKGFLK